MKSLRIVLILLAVAVLALPAVFGWITEAQVYERVESLRENETLAVEIESYDRAWFSSTALITITPASSAPAVAGSAVEPLPLGTLFTRPFEVVVDFSHGPVSLRDGIFVGASEMVARPAVAASPYAFEFRGQSTFDGKLHFAATLPPIDQDIEGSEVMFSGGRLTGTVAGSRLTAQAVADTLQWVKGPASLSLQGIRASADNELLSRYRMPGTVEVTVARAAVDVGADRPAGAGGPSGAASGPPAMSPSALIDAAGLAFRSDVELDAGGDLIEGSMSLAVDSARTGSARTGNETRLANGSIASAATRIDAAALEAYAETSRRLAARESGGYVDELEPAVERLLAAGPTLAIDPLRVDVDGDPFEARVFLAARPDALPAAGPLNLREAESWYRLLTGRVELTAAKALVERIATAVVKSQLAADFLEGSSVPFEALDTMAEAQAGFVIALLAAQGMIEDSGVLYRTEVRLEDGKLTVNGRSLPVGGPP